MSTVPCLQPPQCFNCDKTVNNLKKCSRCKLVYYCSQNCQKDAFQDHKEFCKKFNKLQKAVQKQAQKLTKNGYFKDENVGHFWQNIETRNYCYIRNSLASHILIEARSKEIKPMYESALDHYMELLRLCHGDNLSVRDEAIFILLRLNRIEDAYNFIKWWMTIDLNENYNWNQPPISKQGEWLYLQNEDIHEDLLQIIHQKRHQRVLNLNFLASLFLIKMQIIYRLHLIDRQIKCIRELLQSEFQLNDKNRIENTISLYLAGGNEKYIDDMISEQLEYANKYLDKMMERNEIFLKAVINPQPMIKHALPNGYMFGSPEEAYLVMRRCRKLFMGTDGTFYKITQRVGKHPQYEYQPFMEQKLSKLFCD
eukprot:471901_1